jgi:hypothetical protein
MLKKFFFLGFLVFLALLIVGGWFGYQAFVHGTNTVAIQQRQLQVIAAWQTDPAAMEMAAKGKGGVKPSGISDTMRSNGVVIADSYRAVGQSLTIAYTPNACGDLPYTFDIKRSPGLITVVVYADASWWPDVVGLWNRVTSSGGCTAAARQQTLTIALDSRVGADAVVDAASGTSLARKS